MSWVGLRTRPTRCSNSPLAERLEQDQDRPRRKTSRLSWEKVLGGHSGGFTRRSFLGRSLLPLFWPRPIAFANSDRVLAYLAATIG